jgi:hypothetical protein
MTSRTSVLRFVTRRTLGVFGATVGAGLLVVAVAVSPLVAPPSVAEMRAAYAAEYAQGFDLVASTTPAPPATGARDGYTLTPGPETYIQGGTNYDWAKLVLLYAGWPITDDSVTVITRWMRQENYVDSWWTRNNPLNLGHGGYATNSDLVTAAQAVGTALKKHPGYADIIAGFANGSPSSQIEYAIWWSPWSTSHYGNGTRWATSTVPVVQAPASAWGR